jgi:hypothetical protein
MKLGMIALVLVAMMGTAWIDVPPVEARYTWADLGEDLQHLRNKITNVREMLREDGWQDQCRGYSPEKTVRCAAEKFDTSAEQAVSVWQCESNFGIEPEHTDAYHGPYQYLYSTYEAQRESMPDVVEWYELSPAVHDVRSNILTAVAWASRHGWGPWGCA